MKAYKVELLIIDHDEVGVEDMKLILEETKYSNRCIHPTIMAVEEADIGEWDDDHPLNDTRTQKDEYRRLFGGPAGKSK